MGSISLTSSSRERARRANIRKLNLVSDTTFALGPRPIGRGPLEKAEDVEASELGPDGLGGGRDRVRASG